jgi:hypothetical protein
MQGTGTVVDDRQPEWTETAQLRMICKPSSTIGRDQPEADAQKRMLCFVYFPKIAPMLRMIALQSMSLRLGLTVTRWTYLRAKSQLSSGS